MSVSSDTYTGYLGSEASSFSGLLVDTGPKVANKEMKKDLDQVEKKKNTNVDSKRTKKKGWRWQSSSFKPSKPSNLLITKQVSKPKERPQSATHSEQNPSRSGKPRSANRPQSAPLQRPSSFLMVSEKNVLDMSSKYAAVERQPKQGNFLTIRPIGLFLNAQKPQSPIVYNKKKKETKKKIVVKKEKKGKPKFQSNCSILW